VPKKKDIPSRYMKIEVSIRVPRGMKDCDAMRRVREAMCEARLLCSLHGITLFKPRLKEDADVRPLAPLVPAKPPRW
jgi:hypothetical protein